VSADLGSVGVFVSFGDLSSDVWHMMRLGLISCAWYVRYVDVAELLKLVLF
jgi:hypothetical protein